MENHEKTSKAFIEHLKQLGYPEESIITEWGAMNNQIDIAILDEGGNFPVAIYEVKAVRSKSAIDNGIRQLRKCQNFIGYPVETAIVFPMERQPYFELYSTSNFMGKSDNGKFMEIPNINPNKVTPYKSISKSAEPKIKNMQRIRKEKYLDGLKVISWAVLSPLTIGLIILDFLNLYTFTTERLVIIGLLLLVVVMPFYKEISFKGVTVRKDHREAK